MNRFPLPPKIGMNWWKSNRFDAAVLPIANRHYNRQKPGTPQFAPPGSCVVFKAFTEKQLSAFWVTSFPLAEYTKHAWAGSWVCTAFRNESALRSSDLILEALAASKWHYGEPPPLGIITFVNPKCVPGIKRRGSMVYGYCFKSAGFEHVGFTKGGLWAWQLLPNAFPPAQPPLGVLF